MMHNTGLSCSDAAKGEKYGTFIPSSVKPNREINKSLFLFKAAYANLIENKYTSNRSSGEI